MWAVELVAVYLYALKWVVVAVAVIILLSGVDDLFIDAVYWLRRIWRRATVYRKFARLDRRTLLASPEKPFAIMVPAWQEKGVIGQMAELAATTLDYESYHIFVGTYPNDAETQQEVDLVSARFRNVHKVVCARPGPTSKADCLNNVLDAILQFEQRTRMQFAGFVLHDAEDVVNALELRLFNHLVVRKDLIQLPVYPFERGGPSWTSSHYLDEFAEVHGKDMLVREALAGQVPSAGVGTCFSRRAVLALLADGNGIAFDPQSLTEDYDIGIRLRAKGMSEVFVRLPVSAQGVAPEGRLRVGQSRLESAVICVREYFPNTLRTAVRQKSRWIVGIVYQGLRAHRWTADPWMNYFLWRDRKGVVTNFASFIAFLLLVQLMLLWAYQTLVPDSYRFLSIFEGSTLIVFLLSANLVLMCNRIVQRVIFVTSYYGLAQGLWSVPRLLWGNFVNFLANWRALSQVVRSGDARRVAWDKTTHDFPSLAAPWGARMRLGSILIEHGWISQPQLEAALLRRRPGLKLGVSLLREELISGEQLASAIAHQGGIAWESVDAIAIDPTVIRRVPGFVALRYGVIPVREEAHGLIVASETAVDPVSLAALARKLGRPVVPVIALQGEVTYGLRHWYARRAARDERAELAEAVRSGRITAFDAPRIWRDYVSRQVMLRDVLASLGHLDAATLYAAPPPDEWASGSFGETLVRQGIVDATALAAAMRLQRELQGSIGELLDAKGMTPERLRSKAA